MNTRIFLVSLVTVFMLLSCTGNQRANTEEDTSTTQSTGGQEAVQDDESQKDIVKIAVGSDVHTTLVKALQQADLVTSMANAGPFTVFAPTDEAFAKVDAATLEFLMKDENKSALQNILEYHVTLSALKAESLKDGQSMWMANGDNVTFSVKDGKVMINDSATILGSVQGSNGIVHVIDAVLLPPDKE